MGTDERRLVGTQPDGGGRDFLGSAEPSDRQMVCDLCPGGVVDPREVVSQDRPRGDRVDADSILAVVDRG